MNPWKSPPPRSVLVLTAAAIVAASAGSVGVAQATTRSAPSVASAAPTLALSDHGGARRNSGDRSNEVKQAIDAHTAKNVILLIGDGMGDSEITVARNYAKGAAGRFAGIDALPLTGQYTTYSLNKATGLPDYVPDSAATGSAWSTGTKTYDNAISVDIAGKPQQTILELAKTKGLKTGDITTSEIQDATPAVLVSHISARSCYGPTQTTATCPTEALENGGLGSITEQLLNTRPDVTMGGGATTFAQKAAAGPYQGKTLTQQATERGYQMVGDKVGLDAITSADQTAPLLGLFAPDNLPVNYTGPAATIGGAALPAVPCTANPDRPATQPTLSDMTDKAIKLLDNPKGFFLQVEGASIDKRDHASDACGQIGETVDFDGAVQVALAYAKAQGNTSVFVTADHGHTSQIIEVGSSSPAKTVTLTTADNVPMAINYGTSTTTSQQHTGTQVRIAGYGPKAANIVGLTDQTDLYYTMTDALFGTDTTVPPPSLPAPSSKSGRLNVRTSNVAPGQLAVAVARGFDADSQVLLTIKGGGRTVSSTRSLSKGVLVLLFQRSKPGSYAISITGKQSGVKADGSVRVG